jgi:hypothetical protein
VSYDAIMKQAGRYSAEWAFAELPTWERAMVVNVPPALRSRAALYLSRRLVKDTFRGSRARTRVRKGRGTVDIRASVFCEVREPAAWPMCVFYSAAVERFLHRFDLDANVDVTQCRASGGNGCSMTVTIRGQHIAEPAAEAA